MGHRSSSVLPGADRSSIPVPVPPRGEPTDIAVVKLFVQSANTITPPGPAGTWIQRHDSTFAANVRLVVFWKRLTGYDTGTWTFTTPTSQWVRAVADLQTDRDVSAVDPFTDSDSSGTPVGGSNTTVVPSLDAAAGDDLVGGAVCFNDDSWTPPAGTTERQDITQGITLVTQDGLSAGPTGSKTFTASSASGMASWVGLLAVDPGGPAFDSSAFDGTAFSVPVSGTPSGSGSGTVAFAGSASGARAPKASGAGVLAFTGSAVGDAPANRGSGTGSLSFVGAAAGKRTPKASSSGTVTFTGTASGATVRRGTGTGSLSYAGTATGKRTPQASGNGTLAFVGTSAGKRAPKATGAGGLTFTGSAVGNAPGVGMSEGFGTGSLTFTGAATGRCSPKGGGSGSVAFAGTAAGRRQPVASSVGGLVLTGTALGVRQPVATAVGSLTFTGLAVGATPGPPTDFEGRILAARLSIPTAAGSLSTRAVTGRLSTPAASGELDVLQSSARLSIAEATGVIA